MSKKAFVHDRIVHLGGAEQVFIDLIRVYGGSTKRNNASPAWDNSPLITTDSMAIFSLFSNRKYISIDDHQIPITVALPRRINQLFIRGSRPETTKLCKIRRKLLDYRNLIVFYPWLTRLLARKIRKFNPQLVVISSFAAVKNVVEPDSTLPHSTYSSHSTGMISRSEISNKLPHTILYLHSPMQYIHENYEEYVRKLSKRQLRIFKPLAKKLRKRDLQPRTYDEVFVNSNYTAECVQRYYNFKATTRYPHIDKQFIMSSPTTHPHSYYIYVGRLVKFIREADLIIQLFNQLQLPLLVMGSGPDEFYLKSIAGETITFVGQVDTFKDRLELIKNARGLINLTKESCGIATMEALALGVPVFGYNAGATPELVDEKSGLLVDSKQLSTLVDIFGKFKEKNFDRIQIKERFLQKINV